MQQITRLLLLYCLIVTSGWAQARPKEAGPAPSASEATAPTAEETARAAKFFAAQQRLHATDAKIKLAADTARVKREETRTKAAAGAALRRQGRPKNLDERKAHAEAREAEIDAEVQAEMAQIALEEAVLEQVLKDEPDLAGLVAAQRQEIAARKKMLAIRANSAGRLELDPEEAASRPIPPAAADADKK
ncbi:MAG: hypothetical protein ACOZE5_18135 [Verrucomicrobiota bacterium]